jgi:hypothetical protein
MNTNSQDQWFEPGDKVMRVAEAHLLGFPNCSGPIARGTEFGNVLCVQSCVVLNGINRVFFVGIESHNGRPFFACCFRRVTEIQLINRATRRQVETVTQNV